MDRRRQLYGRDDELRQLNALVDRAREGKPFAAVVKGEAGIGKSSIVSEIATRAADAGLVVVSTGAHELEQSRPFGPFIEAGLTRADADSGGAFAIIDEIADALQRMAQTDPLLLVIEDAHWADDGTATALARIARSRDHLGTSLIVTTRPSPRGDALAACVREVEASGGTVITIRGLSLDAVGAIAQEELKGAPGERLLGQLAATAGNPLYAHELLAAVRDDGTTDTVDGVVDLTNDGLPPSLPLTILRRLGFLPTTTIDTLRAAAVLGSPFRLSDLAAARGAAASEALGALRPAIDADVVRPDGDDYRFRHDLIRDAVYFDLPASARAALHLETARALVVAGASVLTIAEQFDRGATGKNKEAAEWLRLAVREVNAVDVDAALHFGARSLARMPEDDPVYLDLEIRTRHALISLGPRPEHRAELERRRALVGEDLCARWLCDLTLIGHLVRFDDSEAAWRVALAEPRIPLVQAQMAAVLCGAARDFAAAEDALNTIMANAITDHAIMEEYATRWFRGNLDWANAIVSYNLDGTRVEMRWLTGRAAEAGRIADAMTPSRQIIQAFAIPEGGHSSALMAYVEADRPQWRAIASHVATIGHNHSMFEAFAGVGHWVAGDWDEAMTGFDTACARGLNSYVDNLLCVFAGVIAFQRGDVATAQTWLERAQGMRLAIRIDRWLESLLAADAGDLDRAMQLLRSQWDRNEQRGFRSFHRYYGPDAIRLALRTGEDDFAAEAADALEELAVLGDTGAARASGLHGRGLVTTDGALLIEAANAFEAAGRPTQAADARADAVGALAGGDRDVARRELDAALAFYEAVGAVRAAERLIGRATAAGLLQRPRRVMARPRVGWESLTPAETRVVELVADGLTYGDVGAELFISRRTVETHVAHVFDKLGVKSKTELIRAARQRN